MHRYEGATGPGRHPRDALTALGLVLLRLARHARTRSAVSETFRVNDFVCYVHAHKCG